MSKINKKWQKKKVQRATTRQILALETYGDTNIQQQIQKSFSSSTISDSCINLENSFFSFKEYVVDLDTTAL